VQDVGVGIRLHACRKLPGNNFGFRVQFVDD
jgi:hypothetical protein